MDWILTVANQLVNFALSGLPDSPFPNLIGSIPTEILQTLNWCIGIGQMLTVLSAWLVAVGLFYIFRAILAWAKVIGS